jgi:hypothetical protein
MAKKLEDKIKVVMPTPDFVDPQVITVSKSEFKEMQTERKAIGYIFLSALAAIALVYVATGEASRLYNAVNNHDWKAEYQNFRGFPQP